MRNSIPEIPVLYFHSVAPARNKNWVKNYLTLELHYFEQFLIFLSEHNYDTILFDEYLSIIKTNEKHDGNVCLLTFDDGYIDNYIYVWPLLKKYGFKGTIFINPQTVDLRRNPVPTLNDVWCGNAEMHEIEQWGYLSWHEMKIMQESGIIDIQSHSLTHTKYFVSDKLTDFHHPGDDCHYPIGNLFPDRSPYYINDTEYETLIPFGYPFFEEKSAVIAKKVEISPDFIKDCVRILQDFDFKEYRFDRAFDLVKPLYDDYRRRDKLIVGVETKDEFEKRVTLEIFESKRIIEEKIKKPVSFLCWPHGDNSEFCHRIALNAGYLMTTRGNALNIVADDFTRIGERLGVNLGSFGKRVKTMFKIKAFSGKFPYNHIVNLSRFFSSK